MSDRSGGGGGQLRDAALPQPVERELLERRENFDVIEIPEKVPNLLGLVPLEVLDLVVDAKGPRLIPNPEHGGEQMTDEF